MQNSLEIKLVQVDLDNQYSNTQKSTSRGDSKILIQNPSTTRTVNSSKAKKRQSANSNTLGSSQKDYANFT